MSHPPEHDPETADERDHPHLESGQRVADKSIIIPLLVLSSRATVGLWILRIAVVVVTAMVFYVFISQLA